MLWAAAVIAAAGAVAMLILWVLHRRALANKKNLRPLTPAERAAGVGSLGLLVLVAVLAAFRGVGERVATEQVATDLNGSERNATDFNPSATEQVATHRAAPQRYTGQRQQEFAERWAKVCREVGPPPTPDAVPVVGYAAGGVAFPSRWRTAPDATAANNFKQPGKGE